MVDELVICIQDVLTSGNYLRLTGFFYLLEEVNEASDRVRDVLAKGRTVDRDIKIEGESLENNFVHLLLLICSISGRLLKWIE